METNDSTVILGVFQNLSDSIAGDPSRFLECLTLEYEPTSGHFFTLEHEDWLQVEGSTKVFLVGK